MTGRNRLASIWAYVGILATAVLSAQTPKAPATLAPLKQTAFLKASNPHMGDRFGDGGPLDGHAVALSGDGNTLAVGAPSESSAARGVDGNQNDTSLYGAGAVYIFTRQGA